MVSELLGSFGDNELSPECLDGARAFLKRKRRIYSINFIKKQFILLTILDTRTCAYSGWCVNPDELLFFCCAGIFVQIVE